MKLLLIEDNLELAATLQQQLEKQYILEVANSGQAARQHLESSTFDLVILDLSLPDVDGFELCQHIRLHHKHTPILMMTGQAELQTKVKAFELGADDYVVKPFAFEELQARIKALLRRPYQLHIDHKLSVGDLLLDLDNKTATRDKQVIYLRRKEFNLLAYLMRNAGRVVTREMLLSMLWKTQDERNSTLIDVHIKYLRDKVDRQFDKKIIKTVHGIGHKLEQ